MVPNHNFISNVVYSANGADVKATICDGKVLMKDGKVEGEEKIIKGFARAAEKFVNA
jgi:5-methylthioadenosine/S-adenosylhomocysteine deaminase